MSTWSEHAARKRNAQEAEVYRLLQTPEKIDQLAVDLAMMGIRVPARDIAFFQATIRRWLASPTGDKP